MTGRRLALLLLILPVPFAARAQLLPSLPGTIDRTVGGVTGALPDLRGGVEDMVGDIRGLARAQAERVRALVRRYPDSIAVDSQGNAVRAGELVLTDPDDALVQAAQAKGFRILERENLGELGIGFARFAVPEGVSLDSALRRLRALAGGREVSADPLHFASGALAAPAMAGASAEGTAAAHGRIGIVDGGVLSATPGLVRQQAFATGGARPQDHAAAIASLLTGGGGIRASAGGAELYVADVYGSDPAGGSATAISRALAWMTGQHVPVVVVSLVGPANPLLGRVVAAARARGTLVVAAVGNDGPAAPPAYPASYPQALAVTGVDSRNRPLIEAGRARKLDYAAPGADMLALDAAGRPRPVRGTSFAAPFVAARLTAHLPGADLAAAIAAVDREAKGKRPRTGRGIVCADCRTPARD